MDFNKFKTFQEVSEKMSISAAAESLRRSQSAISQQIIQLEEELGFKLFKRRRGKIFLSDEGKQLLQNTSSAFSQIETSVFEIKSELNQISGRIKIGTLMDYSTPFDLSSRLVKFSQKFPQVSLEIVYGTNVQIENWLKNGEIDLGISIVFQEKSDLIRSPICTTTHVLASKSSNAKKLRGLEFVSLLKNQQIIDFSKDFLCLKPWVQRNFPEQLAALNKTFPVVVVPNFRESLKFIELGWGIGILPDYLVSENATHVKRIYQEESALNVTLDIAYLNTKNLKKPEQLLLSILSEEEV